MTQDEFAIKWRYELFGLIMDASNLNCTGTPASAEQFRKNRESLLKRVESDLVAMYADLSQPVGQVPAALLTKLREAFAIVKDLESKKAETPKGATK